MARGAALSLAKPPSQPSSFRNTSYTAPAEAVQESATWLAPGLTVSVGVAGGVQPLKVVLAPGSLVQAMPWRLKAA